MSKVEEQHASAGKNFSSVYGPVKSWRTGTSLGIDPIGSISTCSFNCIYCQLGKIQKITTERSVYITSSKIIEDLDIAYNTGKFTLDQLDVITFAGSGEPTLAANLGQSIDAINTWQERKYYHANTNSTEKKVPISILTNATLLLDKRVRDDLTKADLISLKLDAFDKQSLEMTNQNHQQIKFEDILNGIKILKKEINNPEKLQLQIMFMPKIYENSKNLDKLIEVIQELNISKIQINTPSRPKPMSGNEYWSETRGNHYTEQQKQFNDDKTYKELPVISKELAFKIEERIKSSLDFEVQIINVYRR